MATLSEAIYSTPFRFNPQSLLNHDAMARPWSQLPPGFPRTAFDAECVESYDATARSRLLEAIRSHPALTQPRRVKVLTEDLQEIFGKFRPGHAFLALCPDWGIRLTEPMATRGLAHLLGRGSGRLRAKRIRAFLEALRIPDIPADPLLEQARVYSEADRIDLEVRFQKRVVLVEAKFAHTLTKGQLSKYYEARKGYHGRDCRIVGLTPDAGTGRHHKQVKKWPVMLWRDLWLRFEQRRPCEADGQLAAFMAWLWQRVGGLNPKSK